MKPIISLVIAALVTGSTLLHAQEVTETAPPAEPSSEAAQATPPPSEEKTDKKDAAAESQEAAADDKEEVATEPAKEPEPEKPVTTGGGTGSFNFKIEPARIDFNFHSDGPLDVSVDGGFVKGFWFSPFMLLWRSGLLILWVALSSATAALFQPAILRAQAELQAAPGRSAALGFLWLICFWILLAAGVVMALVLIGLPFILVLVVFDLALRVFGLTVTFAVVGQWIARRLNRPGVSIYAAVFIGACALGLLRLIPVAGSVIWFAAALFGIGATLAARFGTANNPPALSYPTGAAPLTA